MDCELFSGLYHITDKVLIVELEGVELSVGALLPTYLDEVYAHRYLMINMSDQPHIIPSTPQCMEKVAHTTEFWFDQTRLDVADCVSSRQREVRAEQKQGLLTRQASDLEAQASEGLHPAEVSITPTFFSANTSPFQTGKIIDGIFRGLPYPPLRLCLSICLQASRWLARDETHVILLHCFKGLSRCRCFLMGFLVWAGMVTDCDEAAGVIAAAVGVGCEHLPMLPSQRRFVNLFIRLMELQPRCRPVGHEEDPTEWKCEIGTMFTPRKLQRVILSGIPGFTEPPDAFNLTSQSERVQCAREGNAHDECQNKEDVTEAWVSVFRPILEVWLQGSLIYSSVEHLLQRKMSLTQSHLEGHFIPAEVASELEVYAPDGGTVVFDISAPECCGDLLLRLVHVLPVIPDAEDNGFCCCNKTNDAVGLNKCRCHILYGRKVPVARTAFHTASVDSSGCIQVRSS